MFPLGTRWWTWRIRLLDWIMLWSYS